MFPAVRRAVAALALASGALLLTAAPAGAHTGTTAATDYRAEVTRRPAVDGVSFRIIESGGRIELQNRSDRPLVVLGYEDEPYLRVTSSGVYENRRSPAVYLNATRSGGEQPPADATAGAAPRWVRISSGDTARWHDHRLHWMASTPPSVRQDPDRRQEVERWQLPVRVGDRRVTYAGSITYVPGPASWPWLLVAATLAGIVVLTRRLAPALLALVAAEVVRIGGLSLAVVGGLGDRVGQALDVGAVDLVAVVLAVAAASRLRRRTPDSYAAAGIAAIVAGVSGGLLEWSDLARSQLVVAGPAALGRAAITACAGLGLGVAVAAVLEARRPRSARQ